MSKKFDVVIGNPPYQDEASGEATHNMPVYHLFMDAAYEVGRKAVLVTPARFLFNAGYTPKAWNEKMLSDPHLTVSQYVPNSDNIFPGTDIKGGIAVTYRDEDRNYGPIGTFTKSPVLYEILNKVTFVEGGSIASVITSSRSYRYTDEMHADYPTALGTMAIGEQYKINTRTFEQLSFLYNDDRPADSHAYSRVVGLIKNNRVSRWIRSEYISGPESFGTYKLAISKASGSGTFGETLSTPIVLEPNAAVTQSFITVGAFRNEDEAKACLKYVKSKFARTLLGVLKITQDNPAKVWKYIPLQDFTGASDIDWSKSIPEIDQQLYEKYELNADEIAFIESNVKPME